jgi:hypothetical protein
MRSLIWGKNVYTDVKKAIKKNPKQKDSIEGTLSLLVEEPFAPKLETHKLKGK